MRQLSLLICAILITSAGVLPASPGTQFRDWIRKHDPSCEKLWKLLEITPLIRELGNPVLRIWDDRSSFTILVHGDTVILNAVHGYGEAWFSIASEHDGQGKRIQNAEDLLEAKKSRFEIRDAAVARDFEYLISRITAFDSDASGADGSFTFIDAVDRDGKFCTFEVWSPHEDKHPLAFDLCHLFWTFTDCIRLAEEPAEKWKGHDKVNFMTRFSGVTGVNLTQEKAQAVIREGFKNRIQNWSPNSGTSDHALQRYFSVGGRRLSGEWKLACA